MKLPTDLQRVLAFVHSLGFSYALGTDVDNGPQWRGDGTLRAALDEYACSDLLHELAHALLAQDGRARCKDFGLGRSPEGGMSPRPRLRVPLEAEPHASLLGILLERSLRVRTWPRTYDAHGWYHTHSTNIARYVRDVLHSGLVERYVAKPDTSQLLHGLRVNLPAVHIRAAEVLRALRSPAKVGAGRGGLPSVKAAN